VAPSLVTLFSDIIIDRNYLKFRRNGKGFVQDDTGTMGAFLNETREGLAFAVWYSGVFTQDGQGCYGWCTEWLDKWGGA
jgi:hypothetical protein